MWAVSLKRVMIHALYGAGHAAENALYRRLVGCELRAHEVMNGFV